MGRKPTKMEEKQPQVKKKVETPNRNEIQNTHTDKKKIRDMTRDEKKEYDREVSKRYRERQKVALPSDNQLGCETDKDPSDITSFKVTTTNMNSMSLEEKKKYYASNRKINREKRKLCAKDLPEIEDTDTTNGHLEVKRYSEMSNDEKRAYKTTKQKKRREKQKESLTTIGEGGVGGSEHIITKKRRASSIAGDVNHKKSKTDTNIDSEKLIDEVNLDENEEQKIKCTLRVALMDLFEIEAECLIIPHYGKVDYSDSSALYNQYLKKVRKDADEREELKRFFESNDIEEFTPQAYTCNQVQLHIQAPIVINNKYTVVTEAKLRATYLSCLHQSDINGAKSVAFPIIGKGVWRQKSVALAIQIAYAYIQSSTRSNLQLIYLVTRNVNHYDEIGEFMSYIRTVDLTPGTQDQYFKFEDMMFNKMKKNVYFSTIPGTDMIWRALKTRHTTRQKKFELAELQKIHRQMCDTTGVNTQKFQICERAGETTRAMPSQHMSGVEIMTDEYPESIIAECYPMENVCGSNSVLRKIWIISYFYMYYVGPVRGDLNFSEDSETFQQRKRLFHDLKHLHREVSRQWKRTVTKVPFKCSCLKTRGYHENLMIFSTPMSLRDDIFETWVLNQKLLLLAEDQVHKMEHMCIEFAPKVEGFQDKFQNIHTVKSVGELKETISETILDWFQNRKAYFTTQNQRFLETLTSLNLDDKTTMTGIEASLDIFSDVRDYDDDLDEGLFADDHMEKDDLEEAKRQISLAQGLSNSETKELADKLDECKKNLALKRFAVHNKNEVQLEMIIRNRIFRRRTEVLPHVNDLWRRNDEELLTVDQFIEASLQKRGIRIMDLPNEVESDTSLEEADSPYTEQLFGNYPETIDLGSRTDPCGFCGAFAFPNERLRSCCKKGAVWIPPIKLLPPEIKQLFRKKFRVWLIATNAAFSMASVSYTRQQQAPHGINSMKVRGIVSFHPSALHPNDPNRPRYANFIVLDHNNEKIATERFSLLKEGNMALQPVFEEIQTYMDKNNQLYDCYKSMIEMEKECLDNSDEPDFDTSSLKFRIVPPTELEDEDLKALSEHTGVYARPNRIAKGYITVAYSWNTEDSTPIPRGLTVYPKNPRENNQRPLSIYSDLCDQMCYPLFHPEATGGWALHKYPRWTEKGARPTYKMRIADHVRSLETIDENPEDYYLFDEQNGLENFESGDGLNSTDDDENSAPEEEEESDHESVFKQQKSSEKRKSAEKDHSDDDEDEDDDDPLNLSDEGIIEYGRLEDLQEVPLDDEVGKQPNIEMCERKGEWYPVINKKKKTVDIPYISGNPFGSDSEDEDHLLRNRFNDVTEGTDENFVFEGEGNGVEKHIEVEGEDLEITQGTISYDPLEGTSTQEHFQLDSEDVCFDDEHNTESLALGRHNDGVRVKNVGQRQYVSMAEYANFVLQERQEIPCRYQGKSGPLGQLAVIDWACRIREGRMAALTERRAEYARITTRNRIFEFYQRLVQKQLKGKKKLGMLVTMPSTVPGTSKYQRELVMSAVTVSNKFGSPHLFLTFTGNPNWPEIKRECERQKCQWADIPQFVCSVFKNKLDMFMDDVVGKKKKSSAHNGKTVREPGIFGAVKWYTYSVEFQQRGMPHIHLLLSLEDPITNAEQVNRIISAEVPDFPSDPKEEGYEDKLRYYEYVKGLMTHFPCENDPSAYCNDGKKPNWKKCCKGFPHDLVPDTIMCDNHYPKYKRSSNNKFNLFRKGKMYEAGSEYVVAHNPYLLLKYGCHINVEVVSSIKTMKYMFKYIFKGSDRVLLEASENLNKTQVAPQTMTLRGNVFAPANLNLATLLQRQIEADQQMDAARVDVRKEDRVALNDCTYLMDMSAMTACEAAWRIGCFPMHGSSHIVHRGYIHEEGNDAFYIKRGVTKLQAEELMARKSKQMLDAWFEANQNPQKLPGNVYKLTTDLTFPEMMSYFIYDRKKGKFVLRKRDYSERIIGRIQAPQPRWLELTATRILAQNIRGPRSWEELRTFNGVVFPTCLEAARARRLMNGETEWDDALTEVTKTESSVECRRFFASILLHSAPVNPSDLWNRHCAALVDNRKFWTDDQKKAHALRHIKFLLASHGMKLKDFELDDLYNEEELPCIDSLEDYDNPNAITLNKNQHQAIAEDMYKKLNSAQIKAVDRALNMDGEVGKSRMMFVEGAGGTGKTFVYTTIYHFLRARGRNVICLAHTGQAASLLPYGCTAHRKCSIPLEVSDTMTCKVAQFTAEGDALATVDAIIWDEICMSDRRIILSTSVLFQDLKDIPLPFGGVQVIMGGDWRQILPIVDGVQGPDVVGYTLKMSTLWNEIEKFYLTENQRAIDDPEFADMILKIGDGSDYVYPKRQMIAVPEKFIERRTENHLVEWTFPDVNNIESTKSAAILTMDNKTALRINEVVLNMLDGEEKVFTSTDIADKDNGFSVDPEVFAKETPSGMPPHELRLKIGAQVVLLRNLSVEHGLCNGTRMTVQEFGNDVIFCTVNNKTSNSPDRVFLHRIRMSPTGKGANACGFTRLQYPLRLSYACTVNKSQGMTLSKCGLILHSNVFSHGQMYVAMSRVRNSKDFKLWHYKRNNFDDHYFLGGILVRNVVFKKALTDEY